MSCSEDNFISVVDLLYLIKVNIYLLLLACVSVIAIIRSLLTRRPFDIVNPNYNLCICSTCHWRLDTADYFPSLHLSYSVFTCCNEIFALVSCSMIVLVFLLTHLLCVSCSLHGDTNIRKPKPLVITC